MLHSTLIGLLGLAAVFACWGLAVVLFRVGAPGTMSRKLAWLLLIEGVTLITAGFPFFLLALPLDKYDEYVPLQLQIAQFVIHHLGDAGMIALYPAFLAVALRTRLTRPFRHKGLRITIWVVALLMAAGTVVTRAAWNSMLGSLVLYVAVMVVFLFALVASIHAWWVAGPGLERTRARIFAVAFGIRDVCWGISYGLFFFWLLQSESGTEESTLFWVSKGIYALGTLFAVPLIAYGILKAKLFDIDLRIRWTIKQSTLAGLILSIIFLVSEGTATFLSEELGNIAGLLAAAVVIFFLAPLQRFAERIAASTMPNTANTPQYRAYRKMQVYEQALLEALDESGISPKERALLERLRESLEIAPADAAAIEQHLNSRHEAIGRQDGARA